jgi:GNAT superfamily N-acetyltransferase
MESMTNLLPNERWTIAVTSYGSPAAHQLTRALHHEQTATYGTADDPTATPAEEFEPPHGRFLIATRADGAALACGGWRTAGPTTAEIKRMYVDPIARGQGLGQQLLDALEQDAYQRGMTTAILETGVSNHAALVLYNNRGYVPIKPYVTGRNPKINRALSKSLTELRSG